MWSSKHLVAIQAFLALGLECSKHCKTSSSVPPESVIRYKNLIQSVKHLTLDFGSEHDLIVVKSSPIMGSMLNMESA